ncbi:MAG: hypothetical protein Fur0028_15860 [Bacteroidales bacterium]
MAKLKVQTFAKIPNEYISITRSRALSTLEEKFVYMMINTMQKRMEEIKDCKEFDYEYIATGKIQIDEFVEVMQIGSTNRKEILLSIKDLILYSLIISTDETDRLMTMFSEFYIEHFGTRTIHYRFNDAFIKYFTGVCRDFFKLSIEEVIGLNSSHAIRIYQVLKTKQNMDKKEFEYSINEIKKQLNVDKKYTLYANFKNKVLELAKQQINSSGASQFNIDYEEIKTGRAVTSIKFHILPKGKNYYEENNLIAGYKMDQIAKHCQKWKKEYQTTDVVYLLSDKILHELKSKNPSRVVISNYLDTIHIITKQQKLL